MSQVSITLVRADTNQEFDVELPDDALMSELLPALVKELGLPITGPDGNQIAYELSNKRTGREMKDMDTLGGAGTKTGDLMLLTSTFVAGASAPEAGEGSALQGAHAKQAEWTGRVLQSQENREAGELVMAALQVAKGFVENEPAAGSAEDPHSVLGLLTRAIDRRRRELRGEV